MKLASANYAPQPPRRRLHLVTLGLLLMSLGGCSTVSYYYQAASGQWEIWRKSRPISEVLAETPTDSELARRLRLVQKVRAHAEQHLHLPVGESYSAYADLDRAYVVWNLFAAPELSLEPKQWCYPLLGCLSYRGYFDPRRARDEAEALAADGWETHVGGTIAYSTLGWFDDPVLNTFLRLDDAHLAALLFHELAHQVAFAPGDTTFNESFATAVELHGIESWLQAYYGEKEPQESKARDHGEAQDPGKAQIQRLQRRFERREQVIALVTDVTEQLREVYDAPLIEDEKRRRKHLLFDELKQRYQDLRQAWGEDIGFDRWFNTPLNNAKLVTLTSYFDLVPVFLAQIAALDGDLPAFYRWVKDLAALPQAERDRALAQIEALKLNDAN